VSSTDAPVAVIGGGLTGLVAAYTLRHNPPWPEVVLFESSDRLGGKIKTTTCGPATIEAGADSFLAREPVVIDLCRELDLAEELVRPAVFGAQVYSGGRLHPLPLGSLRGVPASVHSARETSLLSPSGALRTVVDLAWPRRLSGPDVSFGRFVRRRFGREVLDNLVSAVMSGTRAGDPDRVSLAAGAPELDAIARRHRSVMRGLKEVRAEGEIEAGPPPFRSLRPGLSRLVDRLVDRIGSVDIRLGTPVERIDRTSEGCRVVASGSSDDVSGVIVTTPAGAAADLLGTVSPDAARELSRVTYSSSASITLVYPAGSLDLPEGSGLLVPAHEQRVLSACTWFSRKWPHLAPPDGSEVVRAFVSGGSAGGFLALEDAELIARAHEDLARIVPVGASPTSACVDRWATSLPQYAVGHLAMVDRIEASLSGTGIRIAGAGLRGSGIPDCVRQGARAASETVEALVVSKA
jgi:oxygen-dependent protoporphyrinogen oxidase